MSQVKPRLVIVSETIRRDLQAPLRLFEQFEIVHLYKNASYGDMQSEDFESPKTIQYRGIFDLYSKIKESNPDILQIPEPTANKETFRAALVCLMFLSSRGDGKSTWRSLRDCFASALARRDRSLAMTKGASHRCKSVMPVFENRPLGEKFGRVKLMLVNWLTKRIGKVVDRIIVLNRGARQNLIKLGVDESKMVSLMWGVWGLNLEEFQPQFQNSNHKLQKRSKILFLGRVSRAKGVPELLKAYEIVKQTLLDVKLTIAGPDGDASQLVTYEVAKMGAVKNSQVPELFSRFDVLVMPSQTTKIWEEQVGMVGLQALACGLPVVTTRSGAIPEYFEDGRGAVLCDEKDVEGIAGAIIKLLQDREYYRQMVVKGREFVAECYEVKQNIREIEKMLTSIK